MKKKLVIRKGFCGCGCGGKTNIAKQTQTKYGHIKGEPIKFIFNHHLFRENHPKWTGGKCKTGKYISKISDSGKGYRGRMREHIEIVEKVMGKALPKKAVIHHVDENCENNKNNNLVVCENQKYHFLLHTRTKALKSCGNVNWVKCKYCKKYDDPRHNMNTTNGGSPYHRECQNNLRRGKRGKK